MSRAVSPYGQAGLGSAIASFLATSELPMVGIAVASALGGPAQAVRMMWVTLALGVGVVFSFLVFHVLVYGSASALLTVPLSGVAPLPSVIADFAGGGLSTYASAHALVLLAAARSSRLSRPARLGCWVAFMAILVAVLLTRNRSQFLGLAIGIAYVMALSGLRGDQGWQRGKRRESLLLVAGLLAVGFSVTPWASALVAPFTGKTYGSVAARYLMWSSVVPLGVQHPVLGIGPGQVRTHLRNVAVDDPAAKVFVSQQVSAHSIFVEAFVERGAVGLILLLWFLVAADRKCRQAALYGDARYAWVPLGVGAVLWNAAVSNMFGSALYNHGYHALLAILLACATLVHTSPRSGDTSSSDVAG